MRKQGQGFHLTDSLKFHPQIPVYLTSPNHPVFLGTDPMAQACCLPSSRGQLCFPSYFQTAMLLLGAGTTSPVTAHYKWHWFWRPNHANVGFHARVTKTLCTSQTVKSGECFKYCHYDAPGRWEAYHVVLLGNRTVNCGFTRGFQLLPFLPEEDQPTEGNTSPLKSNHLSQEHSRITGTLIKYECNFSSNTDDKTVLI